METNNILDLEVGVENNLIELEIISLPKFILLCILSLGLYQIWWVYKSWRFFKEKDSLNFNPATRTIFSIFFLYGLLNKIKSYAKNTGWKYNYPTIVLFIGIIFFSILSYLPEPFMLLSLGSILFFLPPHNALNFAIINSGKYIPKDRSGFNARQIAILIIGSIFWILIFLGYLIESQDL